jgi:hypothetical protein
MPSEVIGLIARRTPETMCRLRHLVLGGMSPVIDNPVTVPDRELLKDKKPGGSEPSRIRCLTLAASALRASTNGLRPNASLAADSCHGCSPF